MRSFLLNKLVRDKIYDGMLQLGQKPKHKILKGDHLTKALVAKLHEESKEIDVNNKDEALKELADLQEVIEALTKQLGSTAEELAAVKASRKAKRGGFTKGIFIGRLDLADDDPWADYYANEPDRFTEIK